MTAYEAKVLAYLSHQSDCLSLIARALRNTMDIPDFNKIGSLDKDIKERISEIGSAASSGFYDQ